MERSKLSIPNFVSKHGWKKFRDIEEDVVKETAKLNNLVIDCGGGVVERVVNVKSLKRNSKIVLLTATTGMIIKRIMILKNGGKNNIKMN